MKKTVLFIVGLLMTGIFNTYAQDIMTCDLEFAYFNPADTVIVVEPGASYSFRMAIINHGPDLYDSLDFVYFNATGVPEGWMLVAEDTLNQTPYMEVGDAIVTDAMNFSNENYHTEENTYEMCFWRIDHPQQAFYSDTNRVNDTLCLMVTYKAWPDSSTAIQTVAREDQVVIYPNPAQDEVYISATTSTAVPLAYRLMDLQGRKVAEGVAAGGTNKALLNLRPFPDGIYFVEIRSGSAWSRHKLMKY